MESEKVKEIKKALEAYGNDNKGIVLLRGDEIQAIYYTDILTLINELESENKDLQDLCNKTYDDLTKEIDRLENEIKGNVFYAKGYAQGIKNTYEVVMPNKLKQFAERLKKKIVSMKWAREDTNEKLIKQGATIKAINGTLNEFLKGENNE